METSGHWTSPFTLIHSHGIMDLLQETTMDDVKLAELLEILGELSVEGETFEVCLHALKLQVELKRLYGNNLL